LVYGKAERRKATGLPYDPETNFSEVSLSDIATAIQS
jgi:hypothetical protein